MKDIFKSFKALTAGTFVLAGLLLLLIGILIDEFISHQTHLSAVIVHLLSHFGIGALVVGALGILIDMDHWKEYFQDRLSEIVVQRKYLNNYNQEQLIDLQTQVLKTYFKNNRIGGRDGFLSYYQNYLQELFAHPVRMDVDDNMSIKFHPDSENKIIISEIMKWTCKSNGGSIQKEIKWLPEENEFESIEVHYIEIKHSSIPESKKWTYSELETAWKKNGGGFIIPLKDYTHMNGLTIIVNVSYTVPLQKFISWRMAHISKNVSLYISYPKQLSIFTEAFCSKNHMTEVKDEGHYYWSLKDWVLAEQGVVIQFFR